ncbi:hypothetical protein GCM10007301_36350 [Azorhizobium oxalatiphilum]|uniref:DUF3606 domain-containing protein n=1 Tax=Azorhizobium oxalatiphilum TaxID=980631 RepID=A0A917C727_9HYPH|nr:DUF3606 domain-containing protein [Azorhizobium oxalatiphilum]GGF73285.1 hypothetical protein GCM10007301_36350 [Azorhizobium oxalatiphilum]
MYMDHGEVADSFASTPLASAPVGFIEAGDDGHEIAYFAKAAGISREQARLLIRQHGPHRSTLMAAARRLKRG